MSEIFIALRLYSESVGYPMVRRNPVGRQMQVTTTEEIQEVDGIAEGLG
jgi:hypothetical protein